MIRPTLSSFPEKGEKPPLFCDRSYMQGDAYKTKEVLYAFQQISADEFEKSSPAEWDV